MPFARKLGHKAPWEAVDAANLRQFFTTVTGQRFVEQIFIRRPKATEKSDAVKRAIQSGVAEGYEEMYSIFDHLTTPASTREVMLPAEATAKALGQGGPKPT